MTSNSWDAVCERIRAQIDDESYRRWFGGTAYASDTGDHITVWLPTEAIRRHIDIHYRETIEAALAAIGRPQAEIRFIVAGVSEDEDDEDV